MENQNTNFEVSAVHQNTVIQSREQHSKGLYYNASYEVENFLQVSTDNAKGDPFKVLNDPTYSGFKIFFHFTATSGLLADESYPNSALAYLKRIGDTKRYTLLTKFITLLSKINSITPWIFQELLGLEDIYKQPFLEVLRQAEIEIKTLETIDNKIMALVEMYRHIVYDYSRHVQIVPENLRWFSMSVYVYDFRTFDATSTTAIELLQTIKNTDVKKLNHVMFELHKCEFDIRSGSEFFSVVDANRAEANTNNIVITSHKVKISSLFKTITGDTQLSAEEFDIAVKSNSSLTQVDSTQSGFLSRDDNNQWLDNTVDRLRSSQLVMSVQERHNEYQRLISGGYESQLRNIRTDLTERAIQRVEGALSRLYLGNVHGFGLDDLLKLSQDDDFRTSFNQLYSRESTTKSLSLGNTVRQSLGNINQ